MRKQLESEVLEKLWRMGVLKQSREQGAGLSRVERDVTVSAFCRRRLGVLMVRNGMVENIKAVCVSLYPSRVLFVHVNLESTNVDFNRRLRSSSKGMCVLARRL